MTVESYIVQPGDGLFAIAAKLAPAGITVEQRNTFAMAIAVANGSDFSLELHPGRILWYDTDTIPVPVPPEPEPDPEPDDLGARWAAALATGDHYGAMTDLMREITGPRTDDLLDVGGALTLSDSWLTANEGNGRVRREDGRWIVEGYRCTNVRFMVSNVTVRDLDVVGAGWRGLEGRDGETGIVVEHFRLDGNGTSNIAIYFPQAREPDEIVLRFGDTSGYRAGYYIFGGVTVEYSWAHDLYFSDGSHNTGSSIRARNGRLWRCLITDGNSAAVNLYPELERPYTGVSVTECGLRLRESDTGPELGIFKIYEVAEPGETREVVGNCFYRGNIGNRHGGGFTRWEGNWRSIDGAPVP